MRKEALELHGRVEAVLVAPYDDSVVSMSRPKIAAVRNYGIRHDRHTGTRLLDVREKTLLKFGLPKGMEIANHRECSVVSAEELLEIGDRLGLGVPVPHGMLGENVVVSGIPSLTELPCGTLLCFRKDASTVRTAVLAVWAENNPCIHPGEAIQRAWPGLKGVAQKFVKVALGRRGIVCSIYASGTIHAGDEVTAYIPAQRIYDPAPTEAP